MLGVRWGYVRWELNQEGGKMAIEGRCAVIKDYRGIRCKVLGVRRLGYLVRIKYNGGIKWQLKEDV